MFLIPKPVWIECVMDGNHQIKSFFWQHANVSLMILLPVCERTVKNPELELLQLPGCPLKLW